MALGAGAVSDSERLRQISTGSILVAIGKLEAQAEERRRQNEKLFEQNERQLEILQRISAETITANARLAAIVEQHAQQMSLIWPRLDELERMQTQGIALRKGVLPPARRRSEPEGLIGCHPFCENLAFSPASASAC